MNKILDLDLKNKDWSVGQTSYINKLYWGKPEVRKVLDVLEGDWFGGNSKFNTEFEQKLAAFTGMRHFQTTNSGSAGLEVAVQTLIQKGIWKSGDKILHPALSFPTSISSAIMAGLIPVYADVGEGTYVLSDESIEKAFEKHPDIAGAIVPALLGNVPNLELLRKHLGDKPLILDSCDVMGSKWDGREVGSYGDFAAYSFYGSHHISTFGVGGGVATNNPDYARYAKSLVFWGRDFSTDGLNPVENFLRRYSYESVGLDAQMSAVQAAFGLAQLERLPEYLGQREVVFRKLQNLFSRYMDYFILPTRVSDRVDISWFCYPLTLSPNTPFSREFFVKYLLDNKVEIRPIMSNLLDNAVFSNTNHIVIGNTRNADIVARRGFFLPACPMSEEQLDNYINTLEGFLKRY